jgi:GT2 family glycosyltransferase
MGISRKVFDETGGYKLTRMGEDIEFSIRIIKSGFKAALITDAFVYHKRRTDIRQFFKQLHFFGRARINIQRIYPDELKTIHFLPVLFTLGMPLSVLLMFSTLPYVSFTILIYPLYAIVLFTDSYSKEKNLRISALATIAGFTQLSAYGLGFMYELRRSRVNKTEDFG